MNSCTLLEYYKYKDVNHLASRCCHLDSVAIYKVQVSRI